jgi:hypothetical protein
MAGVPAAKLRRLVLKELVDNGLDVGAEVTITEYRLCYIIADNGPGIDGSPQDIANLFSIDRPLRSTKLWRKPQRGALGNGLRVVAGSLIASGSGYLVVRARGKRLAITPLADGGANVSATPVPEFQTGTRIEIFFGPDMPSDPAALCWARAAIEMSKGGLTYSGKSSAHWYDAGSFHELLRCSGARPVRDLVANLEPHRREGRARRGAVQGAPMRFVERDRGGSATQHGAARIEGCPRQEARRGRRPPVRLLRHQARRRRARDEGAESETSGCRGSLGQKGC